MSNVRYTLNRINAKGEGNITVEFDIDGEHHSYNQDLLDLPYDNADELKTVLSDYAKDYYKQMKKAPAKKPKLPTDVRVMLGEEQEVEA